jgi:hypothetical protein
MNPKPWEPIFWPEFDNLEYSQSITKTLEVLHSIFIFPILYSFYFTGVLLFLAVGGYLISVVKLDPTWPEKIKIWWTIKWPYLIGAGFAVLKYLVEIIKAVVRAVKFK